MPYSVSHNGSYSVADLIKDLNCPVVIVARPTLGTINHTILTIEFAKQKGLNILGFIVSGYSNKTKNIAEITAPEIISKITKLKCILKIPFLMGINHENIKKVADLYESQLSDASLVTNAELPSLKAPSSLAKQ